MQVIIVGIGIIYTLMFFYFIHALFQGDEKQ